MNHWLAVASADHVATGVEGGFMQVCHGKKGPLNKIKPGDGVVYYSPSGSYGKKDGLMAFTAAGFVDEGEPYQYDMGEGFMPFRRDVRWAQHKALPITPFLRELDFTSLQSNWGYQLRFGILSITEKDFRFILHHMTENAAG
ncbi:MAG: EVE domain-containing protein [Serratia marcescens]|uniref:EVE domain-containing protein n=1 Tax=Serratia marcescens TaxID=615 RepID=UPI0007CC493A|nr:EVE domain-containing protein [Serratia marcescens]SAP40193.1 EVE domain [Klebsiella oxytoca]MDU7807482.1 EVE domain-containing protein [Serratia marcescens]BEO29390.1 UPF0310 protein [Serratia marcescens]HEO8931875.1 EVE domain-containing protein [Serratia marcescens]HEP0988027.1 EVE domain-containing protein [Serratia marcescens]